MTNDKSVPQDATDEVYLEPEATLFDDDLLTSDMIAEETETSDADFDSFDANSLYDDIVTANELVDGTVKGSTGDSEGLLHGLPTQVVHPWRTVLRTAIQHVSGVIVTAVVWLFAGIGIDLSEISSDLVVSVSVLLTLFFSGLVARLMATNAVENFLVKWLRPVATGVSEEHKGTNR